MTETATLGIDLASQPKLTALCRIDWRPGRRGYAYCPALDQSDEDMLALMGRDDVTKVGIDAPFGWPAAFIEGLVDYRRAGLWPDAPGEDAGQREMQLRATDRFVHEKTKIHPLSVSTDKIAFTAMRCARLLAAYHSVNAEQLDRSGQGRLIEVYPAAALSQWKLSPAHDPQNPGSYKGNSPAAAGRRHHLVEAVRSQVEDWLALPEKTVVVCRDSDHCLDSLLCALIARAAELGQVEPIPVDDVRARDEGWIALPRREPLSRLGQRFP
jgi:Protein of unknown function (DUF429)